MGSFNGSGLFVRSFNWVTDKINGVNITASRCDTEDDGFAAGLSNCVTRDGQGKMGTSFNPASDATFDLGAPSAQWRNGYFGNVMTAREYLQTSGRLIKESPQIITNSAAPVADAALAVTPVSSGSYLIEARMLFTADAISGPGGIRVGLFATFINFDSAVITAHGLVNNAPLLSSAASFASAPSATPTFSLPTATGAGFAGNWIHMVGSIRILNITGPPLIGVNWCQNTATPGGNLKAEMGSYLNVTRIT